MENIEYDFLTTIYDKERLRITVQSLSEGNVRFKINDKSNRSSVRAPLSTYIEADIFIAKSDYERALKIMDLSKNV